MLNCKEATLLVIKKEQGKLGLMNRLSLSFHLFLCKYCRWFSRQSSLINHLAKENTPSSLSKEEQREIAATVMQKISQD
ncbi:MAG: hypothetical protein ABIT96_11575 [Ferruginibacter sp.]